MGLRALDEIRNVVAGMEGLEINTGVTSNYPGHAFESELTDLDELVGVFGLEEGHDGFVGLTLCGHMALATTEEGKLDFIGVESYGTEALAEIVKQAGYKGKAQIKKMINSIITLVKNFYNVVSNKNVALKKFGKIIKKYREKLRVVTFEKDDADIDVRDFGKLKEAVGYATETTKSDLASNKTSIKQASDGAGLVDALAMIMASITPIAEAEFKTLAKLDALISDKNIAEGMKELIEGLPFDKETYEVSEAKTKLLAWSGAVESELKKDVKIQDKMRKLVDTLEKTRDKLAKDDSVTITTDQNSVINKFGTVMAQAQGAKTMLFKHVSGGLQGLITDMNKVISAGKVKKK